MIRALFFDAAGTLIEPAEPVAGVYARFAAAAGYPVDPALVKKAFGNAFGGIGDPQWAAFPEGDEAEQQWWRQVVALTFSEAFGAQVSEEFVDACFPALFSHYADPAAWQVFPEVPELLATARAEGFLTAVVSNFDRRLHGILAGLGLGFDAIVTSADACSRKPEPRIFRYALEALGVGESEVFHVGDSHSADLEGARAAGIEAFLVERPQSDLRGFFRQALDLRGK